MCFQSIENLLEKFASLPALEARMGEGETLELASVSLEDIKLKTQFLKCAQQSVVEDKRLYRKLEARARRNNDHRILVSFLQTRISFSPHFFIEPGHSCVYLRLEVSIR